MSAPKDSPPDAGADRDAALRAWERGELATGDAAPGARPPPEPGPPQVRLLDRLLRREPWREAEADPDGYVRPPRRSAFPPSFLAILAAAIGFLALEPSADLPYALFGPSETIDLGRPGSYALDRAVDGSRAKITGFASPRRGSFSKFPNDYEVVALAGTAIIIRRDTSPAPPPGAAEFYQGEGRLLKLDDKPASFAERLVRPAARYGAVRHTFAAYGEIPPGRTAWLLLEGEVPRARVAPILAPLMLWAAALLLAWRAYRGLRERQTAHLRIPRTRI